MYRLTFLGVVVLSVFFVMRQPVASDPFSASEQTRLRLHFDSAEREVRGHPVTGLSIAQRAARMRALDRVHAYAARGVFPTNPDFPGKFVPYFIDRITGTRCGMAYLIEQSGDTGFVARVAATNNNARIPDLKDDPDLVTWLERNGLTLEEAARIQPTYCGLPPAQQLIPCRDEFSAPAPRASTGYKTTTVGLMGADMVAVVLSTIPSQRSHTVSAALGVAAGVVGIGVGATNLDHSDSRRTFGAINTGIGAVSAAVGMYHLTRKRSAVVPVSFAPWFSASGASGLSGRITF